MTLLQILVIAVVAFFCIVFVRDGMKKYVGYNPSAPSLWSRIKAWWPGFVKRHIVDDDPYDDETHAETRYRDTPTPEQVECARAAVSGKGEFCDCPGPVCAGGKNCPSDEYCPNNLPAGARVALAWLKAHRLEP